MCGEMSDTALRRVRRRPAKELRVDIFVCHGLHDTRPGDEHVARAFDHDDEIGDGRRIDGAPGAWTQDQRDLRDDAGGQDVAQEDVRVATERHDAFLDARTAGVIQSDDRGPDLHREIHHLADLLGVCLGQGSAEDREVLTEDEHRPPVDLAVTGDDPVAEERFGCTRVAVRDERIQFDERTRIQQQVEPFAGRQLSGLVLFCDTSLATTLARHRTHLLKSIESLCVGRHRSETPFGLSLRKDRAIIDTARPVDRRTRISTDSVNNSQSVWITGCPNEGPRRYDGRTPLPSPDGLVPPEQIPR